MKIAAIIAEYNPFHNGHAYHLEQTREQTHADYVIAVMNGDFMQRGMPACWNKYTRAAMAVRQGVDAVIELPTLYGTSSAELFALGGVRLLNQLHGIHTLSFGCETKRLDFLQRAADLFIREPEDYRLILKEQLAQGISYPKARAAAALACLPDDTLSDAERHMLFHAPNAVLAVEYLKALQREHSSIQPYLCQRVGADYHDIDCRHRLASATAIRQDYTEHGCRPSLRNVLPETVYTVLQASEHTTSPIDMQDFYPFLQYRLWKPEHPLTDYLDVSEELANRIQSSFRPEYSYAQLVEAVICKQYTYTRVYRSPLHILLDIRQADMERQLADNSMHYARLLAFRRDASPLLRYLFDHSEIPIINKLTDGLRLLKEAGDTNGVALLQQDIASAHLYELAVANRYGATAINEYRTGVQIETSGHVSSSENIY